MSESAPELDADLQLAELLHDERVREREFPVVAETCYLAHAAVCPLPARVHQAMTRYLARAGRGGQFEHLHASAEAALRAGAASMLGADADEIALVPSTSAGLSLIAAGIAWRPGDSVVISQGDFPSNVYPWLRLRAQGVSVRAIPASLQRGVTLEDVLLQLDDSTRLVALSTQHFVTGARAEIDRIGAALSTRGVLFCVDAIQSLGAAETSARHVDFLVADAHKWLLGPQGLGVCFVRRARFEAVEPVFVGWKSVRSERDFVQQQLEFAPSARRYEPGSLNALGVVGVQAALQLLQSVGIATIASRIAQLRERLVPELEHKGYEVLGGEAAHGSGIISFQRSGADMQQLYRALDAARIVTSLRHDPSGRACVRVAPHFYNTEAELERLLGFV
jgi:cysteine desulfurase/selenocysteine lyase